MVAILAFLQSTPWYLIALAIIAAPGFVLWSLSQSRIFWRRHRQTIERSSGIIRDWLDKTGLDVANSPIDTAYYRYNVKQGLRVVSVYRHKVDSDVVTFGINLQIHEREYQFVDALTGAEDSTLIETLRIEFARLGVEFMGLNHPLRTVSINHRITFDENLSSITFCEHLLFMLRAQVLLSELINREAKARGISLIIPQSTGDTVSPPTV